MGLRSVAGPVALDRLAYEAQSAQVVVVGPGIGGGHLGNGRDFWRGEPGLQRSRDPARDLAFDAEDVVQGALVALGPEMMVGPRIDQLHRNQDVVADLLHAAFDEIGRASGRERVWQSV